jgi:hypothetical protein
MERLANALSNRDRLERFVQEITTTAAQEGPHHTRDGYIPLHA